MTREECDKFYNVVKDTHLNIPFHVVKINGEYEIHHTSYDYLKKHNIEIILSADTCDECKKWIAENMKSYLDENSCYSAFNAFRDNHLGASHFTTFESGANWMKRHLLGKYFADGDIYCCCNGELVKCSKITGVKYESNSK